LKANEKGMLEIVKICLGGNWLLEMSIGALATQFF
jgi:hypothetical protein